MKPLKTKAIEWIESLLKQHPLDNKETVTMDIPFYFKIEGFAHEPEVFIRPTNEGLDFGFEGTEWYGHTMPLKLSFAKPLPPPQHLPPLALTPFYTPKSSPFNLTKFYKVNHHFLQKSGENHAMKY